MNAGEVQALVGKPQAVSASGADGAEGATWHYLRRVDEVVRKVSLTTREVPAVNPLTGQSIIINEPVMSDEITTLYEDVDVQMAGERVVEISRRQRTERRIY
ncbi:MAG TPA: hypothetical protein VG734_08955 [Lacunisphaera sp.]|nr:hypothetical protein [Lacunisphaera sp.]